ncbi:dipicolinate synthase subunit DpsA [Desulfosporosinus sp. BICA1-9]|uniref:dipicolinate synthase subunit DpsA n=1 Tax=Desulfosporosinus sp. BICA1-9 TaxID=1531958 RepID=UPI00054C2E3A|nr:dipicolinate synthase subunit DpsA [Desulfosporosinus sp. BICA1-9]KJS47313.1 MAG: dipicolinate synthase [Peptococcaceae bacterium BRH_c23]KJS86546.1 MAG: dipicolinate synthase [Desulfosporosinus sp. BICA1-9]HBW36926.1 dipicolinate synthase subunit DpsA [Desulfosporosinus sp.]
MSAGLKGIRLGVIGGDERELYLISELQKLGAYIVGVGFEKASPISGLTLAPSLEEAVGQVDALLFPMFGTDERGVVKAKYSASPIVLNKKVLESIPMQVPLIIGFARPALRAIAENLGIQLIETVNLNELAILNSIPSAEGAIQMAMEATTITIHGSQSFVIGLGRCGWTLSRMLQGIGAHVTGVARKPSDLARAAEMGLHAVHLVDLMDEIGRAELIFNTVPYQILDRMMLEKVARDAVIVDLASIPGGTDFEYAQMLGIKALLAPGLPGIVAPKTAGRILAQIYPQLILRHLTTVNTICKVEV